MRNKLQTVLTISFTAIVIVLLGFKSPVNSSSNSLNFLDHDTNELVTELIPGESYIISINDSEINRDYDISEEITINIYSENGDIERYRAIEASANSSIFLSAEIVTEKSSTPSPANSVLEIGHENSIRVTYESAETPLETYDLHLGVLDTLEQELIQCQSDEGADCSEETSRYDDYLSDINDIGIYPGALVDTIEYSLNQNDSQYNNSLNCSSESVTDLENYFNNTLNAGLDHNTWDLNSTYAYDYAYECVASYGEGSTPLIYEDQSSQDTKNFCYDSFADDSEEQAISLLPTNYYDTDYVHGWEITEYTIRIDDINEINKLNFSLNATVSRGLESVDCNDLYVFVYNDDQSKWEYISGLEDIEPVIVEGSPSEYQTINFHLPAEDKYFTSRSGEVNNEINILIAGFDIVLGEQAATTLYIWNMDGYGSYAKSSDEFIIETSSIEEEPLTDTGTEMEMILLIITSIIMLSVKSAKKNSKFYS